MRAQFSAQAVPQLFTPPKWHRQEPLIGFAPEWFGVGLFALADVILCARAGLHFRLGGLADTLLGFALLGAAVIARGLGGRRAGILLEYLALMWAGGLALAVASYAAMALSGPLMDAQFLTADRALGFDWLGWTHFVLAHWPLAPLLRFLYVCVGYQALYLSILLAAMGDARRMKEIFWLFVTAACLTDIGACLAPAMGPYEIFGMAQSGPFLPEMAHLKSGHNLVFVLDRLQGVVTFPSFHTVMALGFAYGLRGTGIIGWSVAAANVFLLLGIPVFGGHYLVDIIAGAGVFAVSLGIMRLANHRKTSAAGQIAMAPQETLACQGTARS